MNKASEIKIIVKDDGGFKLETDTGNVLNYNDKELIKVLEETVNQIRGNSIKITGVSAEAKESPAPAPSQPVKKPIINVDDIAEQYHNGGIGPRISPSSDNGFGLGV